MKMPNIAGLAGVGKAFVMANRPEILFGASIVSTVAAVVSAARGGYKSGQQVMEAELTQGPMTNKEKAQLTWINYLPSAGLTFAALGSTTGLHLVHVKEKKALAATALLAIEEIKKESEQYQSSLKQLGVALTDDPAALEAAADEDGVARVTNSDGVIDELYLVRDAKTGRDKWTNKLAIDEAVNTVNAILGKNGDCDLNTFYSHAGFADIEDGTEIGWSGGPISITWKTVERDDGRPVKQFTFRPAPKSGV